MLKFSKVTDLLADDILELLKDGQWHDISEIVTKLNQPEKPIKEILRFYKEFDFIELDRTKKKVVIDPKIRELFL